MSTDSSAKDKLNALMKAVLQVHKSLLEFQKFVYERKENISLTPYDTWHLSVSHPDFEWLRLLSSLVIRLDEASSDKNLSGEETYVTFATELKAIFLDPAQHTDFKQKLETALAKDNALRTQISDLTKMIST